MNLKYMLEPGKEVVALNELKGKIDDIVKANINRATKEIESITASSKDEFNDYIKVLSKDLDTTSEKAKNAIKNSIPDIENLLKNKAKNVISQAEFSIGRLTKDINFLVSEFKNKEGNLIGVYNKVAEIRAEALSEISELIKTKDSTLLELEDKIAGKVVDYISKNLFKILFSYVKRLFKK